MKNVFIVLLLGLLSFSSCKTNKNIQPKTSERYYFSFYRSGCYGVCPSYKITFEEDGSFVYIGKSYVDNIGKHKGSLSKEQSENFFNKLESYDWEKYPNEYPMDNYDLPQFTLEYSNLEFKKQIRGNSNAEKEIIELTKTIDNLIKTLTMEIIME